MKLTKTQKYIAVAVIALLVWWFFLKKEATAAPEDDEGKEDEDPPVTPGPADPPENVDPGHDRPRPEGRIYGPPLDDEGKPKPKEEEDVVKGPGSKKGDVMEDIGPLGPAEEIEKRKTKLGKHYNREEAEARRVAKEQERRQSLEEQEEEIEEQVEKEKAAILKDEYQRQMVEKKAHMTGRSFDQQLTASAEYFARNNWKQKTGR